MLAYIHLLIIQVDPYSLPLSPALSLSLPLSPSLSLSLPPPPPSHPAALTPSQGYPDEDEDARFPNMKVPKKASATADLNKIRLKGEKMREKSNDSVNEREKVMKNV